MSKLFKVTNYWANVRTSPKVENGNRVSGRRLVQDDILEVRPDSRTECTTWVWWEHANTPGYWTASEKIDGSRVLMVDYTPLHQVSVPATSTTTEANKTETPASTPTTNTSSETKEEEPAVTQPAEDATQQVFEVLIGMNVRSKPALGNTLISGESLARGMRLAFTNHTSAGGFEWWEQVNKPGYWTAAGTTSGTRTFMRPVAQVSADDVVRMEVPWITQIQTTEKNYANDCGHTCVLMTLRYIGKAEDKSVKNLYDLTEYRHSRGWTTSTQLVSIANHYDGNFVRYVTPKADASSMTWLKDTLRQNKPVIVLAWYPSLGFNNPSNGMFNHWIVVTGFEGDTFYVNDPLWVSETQGADRPVSYYNLLSAFQTTNSSNKFVAVYPAQEA
ncbi:MAG: C39 family peptidase [Chloroflexota bacterium]